MLLIDDGRSTAAAVEDMHDALSSMPRGCYHPLAGRAQCEQVVDALRQTRTPNGVSHYDGENWVPGPAPRSSPLCGHYIPVDQCPLRDRVRLWVEYADD
jgi:hypothetical protein